jgi:hypothetical protein
LIGCRAGGGCGVGDKGISSSKSKNCVEPKDIGDIDGGLINLGVIGLGVGVDTGQIGPWIGLDIGP